MKKLFKNKIAMFALATLVIIVTFIVLSNPVTGLAMLATFPMILKVGNTDFTVKTQEEKDQMDELLKLMNAITDKAIGGLMTAEKAAELIEKKISEKGYKLEDDEKFKEYAAAQIEQGKALKALQEQGKKNEGKSLGTLVAEHITANKAQFENIPKTNGEVRFALKVAASMLGSTNITGTLPAAQREAGITDYAADRKFLMDIIGTTRTSSMTYEWVEKKNPDGTVAFVLDTEAFALIDFDLDVNSASVKDVGAYITVHENLLNDVEGLAGEIDRELVYQIKKCADYEVLNGVGTTSHLKGILEYATAGFSLTTISIKTPTIWDAISAAMRQVELVGFDQADFIVMNGADYENALGEKDSTGRYVGHPSLSPDGTRFAGIPITTHPNITAGYVLVGNKRTSNIKIYQDIEMAIGYNLTGEFTKRHITVRGGMRMMHFIKDNHVNSWVYDSYADILAAITKETA